MFKRMIQTHKGFTLLIGAALFVALNMWLAPTWNADPLPVYIPTLSPQEIRLQKETTARLKQMTVGEKEGLMNHLMAIPVSERSENERRLYQAMRDTGFKSTRYKQEQGRMVLLVGSIVLIIGSGGGYFLWLESEETRQCVSRVTAIPKQIKQAIKERKKNL